MVMLTVHYVSLSAGQQTLIQKCIYFGKITWLALWFTMLWLTCQLGWYMWLRYIRVCLVFLTVHPYLVLTTLLFCWTMPLCSGVFRVFCLWFLLITLLLCWLLSSPLPCWEFFCLLMTLCIMNVTIVCMHVRICQWIVTYMLQYVFQWIRSCIWMFCCLVL